ncbi:MAG TPA: ISL3 family transposase, partial [Ktedonobacteraceae bacterium]
RICRAQLLSNWFVKKEEQTFIFNRSLFLPSIPFSFPGFTVTEVISTEEKLTIYANSQTEQAHCPACQQISHRIHSYYQRCPRDLPISGQTVQLRLRVRRFRCLNPACSKQTFAEPLPDLVGRTSRRTLRLTLLWTVFAIQSGGEPGARLLKAVGTTVSPDTLLRLARTSPTRESSVPEILGVDDFAFCRGMNYGTLLIDWERHQVVDILADRTAETLASWLQAHPGVKWISRDRSGEYARGAHLGAPEAQQVMDRWHVTKNWREALERVVSRLYSGLEQRLQKPSTPFKKRKKPRTVHEQAISDAAREQRLARYEEVLSYYQQGLSITQIAKQAHLTRTTVYKYLAAESFPERHPRSPSPGTGKLIAPYTAYLRERCEEGCQNAQQLYREIHEQGFSGNPRTVLRWLQAQGLFPRRYELRQFQEDWGRKIVPETSHPTTRGEGETPLVSDSPEEKTPTEPVVELPSARQLSYLFVKDPTHLERNDQRVLAFILQEKELELAYQMTRQLLQLMKNKQGDEAAAWVSICSQSGIAELETFALGIQKELPAFVAACSLAYNNGMTEGFVNKLKHIKGSMYERGSFTLLRQRVLLSAA